MQDSFAPREGGVKIVFDVPEENVDVVADQVSAAGFSVHRYYPGQQHRGGSQAGYTRIGAERAMTEFTDREIAAIVTEFDTVQTGFACLRIGTDTWTAGGARPAGDREPRKPSPTAGAGSAAVGGAIAGVTLG